MTGSEGQCSENLFYTVLLPSSYGATWGLGLEDLHYRVGYSDNNREEQHILTD